MRLPALRHWLIAAALATTPLLAPTAAFAEAPQVKTQAPGFYRMMVGNFEVTALYDGYLDLDAKLLRNASQRDIQRLLTKHFTTGPAIQTAVNAYLINTGSKLVLIDTGTAKAFGPSLGFVADNLKAAGYDPAQVDVVLLTHLHGDHVNGLISADGRAAFPNASVHAAKADADFWLPAAALDAADEASKPFFQMAQAAIAPYKSSGRFSTFEDGAKLIAGIKAVALPGHTPGHSGFMIESEGKRMLVWGDIIHNAASQFENPEIAIEFDVDRKQAVATRQKVLNLAVKEKLMVAGMHLPFPGIGHIRREGKGRFEWVPVEYSPIR
ncbi:MBL fold metallo-hydrolase [Azoarcus communis]|uniref:MBL fold metallo-hydrolase n=1 Tax=Parazoarcus communis TaxID=41977 RepID=UPI001459229A|nr:MBL fold metallo-hydrolase [Parazoarcus communis]NMG49926.1 MBL fold metallo-hydrolase [Parazoarcus communis]